MNFSEKQLVDLFIASKSAGRHHILNTVFRYPKNQNRKNRHKLHVSREFTLPSGKRCDLVVHDKHFRYMWICEFKIVAEPAAIMQVNEYAVEASYQLNQSSRFGLVGRCIAAQFIKPETIFFAERMGVQCLQVSPLNYESCSVTTVCEPGIKDLSWDKVW